LELRQEGAQVLCVPKPKMDEKLKDTRADPKGSGTLKPATKSPNTATANTAASTTLNEDAGAWSTFNSPDGHYDDTITMNCCGN
jgi:hypothetical protein